MHLWAAVSGWVRTSWALARTRFWTGGPVMVAFVLCAPLLVSNLVLIELESLLMPGIASLERDQELEARASLIFVVGHQRSATTNVHEALVAALGAGGADVTRSSNADLLAASYVVQRVLSPAFWALDLLLRGFVSSANHRMGVRDPLEEDLWLLHLGGCHGIADSVFPSLADAPDFFERLRARDQSQLSFVRRCLARRLYRRRTPAPGAKTYYVGCPLSFASMDPRVLKASFPEATWIICSRSPDEAMPSFADLLSIYHGRGFGSAVFRSRMETIARDYSAPLYDNLPRVFEHLRAVNVSFDNWRDAPETELERILAFLGEKGPDAAARGARAAEDRREAHVRKDGAHTVLSAKSKKFLKATYDRSAMQMSVLAKLRSRPSGAKFKCQLEGQTPGQPRWVLTTN